MADISARTYFFTENINIYEDCITRAEPVEGFMAHYCLTNYEFMQGNLLGSLFSPSLILVLRDFPIKLLLVIEHNSGCGSTQ